MIVAESHCNDKNYRAIMEWAQTEGAQIAEEVVRRLPPAVRQAMTSLDEIETGIHVLTQLIGRHVTEVLGTATGPTSLGVCRECGHALRLVDARRALTITGIFGDYHWARPYGVCPQGHGSEAPQDRVLMLGPGRLSPKLAAMVSRLAIEVPFDQVPDVLAQTMGLIVDGELVRRVTEQIGSWAESQEQIAMQAVQQGAAVPTAPGPSTLLISLDGAMVHTKRARDGHQGWHEGKVGVCARFEPTDDVVADGDGPPKYDAAEFCIGFESQAEFLPRLYWHAVQAGLEDPSCRQIVLIGDGAHWIWEEGSAHLRVAGKTWVEILDFYHASQHLWAVAEAIWPDEKPTQTQWAHTVLHRLRHEGGKILDTVWNALPPLTAATATRVAKEQAYFAYHAGRLDYPRYRAMGFPIGSGIIESACKTVLKQRESGSGMRWNESGAQSIATLRALQRSGKWAAFWGKQPWAQLVPPSRRIAA